MSRGGEWAPQGWAEAQGRQERGFFWLMLLSGDTGKRCSRHRCSREGGGVAAGSAAGLVVAQILL